MLSERARESIFQFKVCTRTGIVSHLIKNLQVPVQLPGASPRPDTFCLYLYPGTSTRSCTCTVGENLEIQYRVLVGLHQDQAKITKFSSIIDDNIINVVCVDNVFEDYILRKLFFVVKIFTLKCMPIYL